MNEFSIVQNRALGAIALFSFVKEYYSSKDKTEGPVIPLIMPILPLVFNEDINLIITKNQKRLTSYYKILSEQRTIPVGLQKRMENMYNTTMTSLDMAIAAGIVIYQSNKGQLIPKNRINVPEFNVQENRQIVQSSKLLGFWFSKLKPEEICISLNIQF